MSAPGRARASRSICRADSSTVACTSALLRPSTTSRQTGAVGMYRWTTARSIPSMDSKVRSIRSGLAGVKTTTVTSSGTASPPARCRTKSKSVRLAEG